MGKDNLQASPVTKPCQSPDIGTKQFPQSVLMVVWLVASTCRSKLTCGGFRSIALDTSLITWMVSKTDCQPNGYLVRIFRSPSSLDFVNFMLSRDRLRVLRPAWRYLSTAVHIIALISVTLIAVPSVRTTYKGNSQTSKIGPELIFVSMDGVPSYKVYLNPRFQYSSCR